MMEELQDLDFTGRAWESLYDVVDNAYFLDKDADLIYDMLSKRLKYIPFGEYLKRYIYQKAQLAEPFASIPLRDYQRMIVDSFKDNDVPASFGSTTARVSALAKNWLTQQTVKRSVVFLLGFGLSMSLEDVEQFLIKALREQGINPKDPFEVICWYCLKNRYGFSHYEKLWDAFQKSGSDEALNFDLLYDDATVMVRREMHQIHGDAALLHYLRRLKTKDNKITQSVTARGWFDDLYKKGRGLIADMYNQTVLEEHRSALADYRGRLAGNDRFSDERIRTMIAKKDADLRLNTPDDITEADFERVICSAIPTDRFGNLSPSKASSLNQQFVGKRFSRQHIHDVITGKMEVNRFDLITLNFFCFSQTLNAYSNAKKRYVEFVKSTNAMLETCGLGKLYIANPYECFVLMCILSEDPMGTYADVWELSYSGT